MRSKFFVYCSFLAGLLITLNGSQSSSVQAYFIYFPESAPSLSYLWRTVRHSNSHEARDLFISKALASEQRFWLIKASKLNSLEAVLQLVSHSTGQNEKEYWLKRSVELGHIQSLFELALIENEESKKLYYLKKAADSGDSNALIAYARYLFKEQQFDKASPYLEKASTFDKQSLEMYLVSLLKQANYRQIPKVINNSKFSSTTLNAYLYLAKNVRPRTLSDLASIDTAMPTHCSQNLQFVALSAKSAAQAHEFKKKFQSDIRFNDMPICINEVLWLKESSLKCSLLNGRKHCRLDSLSKMRFTPNFSHLVFFVDASIAYVNAGVMYLDLNDTFSVFIHELAHFAGFVDEYRVSFDLAEAYCLGAGAPNLLFDDLPKETQLAKKLWASSSRNTSLPMMPSKTCSEFSRKSYKPSLDITFMEHHDTDLIPTLYLDMWKALLKQQHQELTVAINFALQERQGDNATIRADNEKRDVTSKDKSNVDYWESMFN